MGAKLGQHFLKDEAVRERILLAAEIKPGERVVEIGPGRGFLTRALLDAGADVTAVELDWELAAALSREYAREPRFKLIAADFLKLGAEEFGDGRVKFVANLPYAVASPILQKILSWPRWPCAVLMFQKEVAERIVAREGADFGLLTLSVYLRAAAEIVADAPRGCFRPAPKVGSSVVRLFRREPPLVSAGEELAVMKLARAAFGQRRKMAAGLIADAFSLARDQVAAALAAENLKPTVRAEDIPPESYLRLAKVLTH